MYDESFYKYVEENSWRAAKIIAPYIIEKIHPKSIVDFGCAEGIWLKSLQEIDNNISILGLDGDYIDRNRLKISSKFFRPADLSKPINLNQRYDLAISFEVAEHIEEERSEIFVENLIRASDHILFSAAIPGQGGENHINEKRQSYWIKKFEKKGYDVDISFREYFWNDERIKYWYKQNILYFFKKSKDRGNENKINKIYDVAHPELVEALSKMVRESEYYIYTIITRKNEIEKIDEACRKVLKLNKDIVIYPYGLMGQICKKILNYKYHISELAISDNKLCLRNPNILSARDLGKLDNSFVVLQCCKNQDCIKEVIEELKKSVEIGRIYNVFDE